MKIKHLHNWQIKPSEAKIIQSSLASKVDIKNHIKKVNHIAGVDVSVNPNNLGCAAIVILSYPDFEIIYKDIKIEHISFPYIPGLLSFREIPLLITLLNSVTVEPDIIFVDGQGITHPRRFGLASHLGILVDIPTIGCAKSLLCGMHEPVEEQQGSYQYVIDNNEIIGVALKTKIKSKPVIISIGHKVDLPNSIKWTLNSCKGYRLPEPCRLAHMASKRQL